MTDGTHENEEMIQAAVGLMPEGEMASSSYESDEAARQVNFIRHMIRTSKNRTKSSVLYLGHVQEHAIGYITQNDPMEPKTKNEFAGWPVVWVLKENYVHLARR